jgi:hypothetical protein
MTKIDRLTIRADEVDAGVFAVQCRAIDGRWLQHEGPKGFAFFTEAQARALVARVYAACEVNEQHWISGGTGYGTFDHEMALIEAEYWEA